MSVTSMHLRSNVDLSTKSPKHPINIPDASDRRSKSGPGPGLPSTDLFDATADGSANMTLRMASQYDTLMHVLDSQGMSHCVWVFYLSNMTYRSIFMMILRRRSMAIGLVGIEFRFS